MELQTMTALELSKKIRQRQVKVADGVKEVFDQIEKKRVKYTHILTFIRKMLLQEQKKSKKESWTAPTPDRSPECRSQSKTTFVSKAKNNLCIKNIRELRTTV